ncbi:hypothetical protein [Pseudotenacibaculum haliotis]|uniref:Phage tail collar domain-containing protein n=1 Tax=Pseudotenacibaculum haliotis TaxID=1862138 RepID=A0ABW5LVC5_9FLAO
MKSATETTTVYVDSVPVGTILVWTKSTPPPKGWQICDGKHGTPDLRKHFIVGSSGPNGPITPSNPYPYTQKGGSTKINLSVENMPKGFPKITHDEHGHNNTSIPSTHGVVGKVNNNSSTQGLLYPYPPSSDPSKPSGLPIYNTTTSGSSKTGVTLSQGEGQSLKHVQPNYPLYFIQKI